ncbi:MAG: hypothetical protein NC254_12455 [bacterium]|nr:hypothetical protein [bacterium]
MTYRKFRSSKEFRASGTLFCTKLLADFQTAFYNKKERKRFPIRIGRHENGQAAETAGRQPNQQAGSRNSRQAAESAGKRADRQIGGQAGKQSNK